MESAFVSVLVFAIHVLIDKLLLADIPMLIVMFKLVSVI